MNALMIGSAIRWALAVGGSYLVTKGIVDGATVTALNTPEIIGGLSALGALAWSLISKKKK
jgi:hypothetical protein